MCLINSKFNSLNIKFLKQTVFSALRAHKEQTKYEICKNALETDIQVKIKTHVAYIENFDS